MREEHAGKGGCRWCWEGRLQSGRAHRLHIHCCSPAAAAGTRIASSSSTSDRDSVRAIHLKKPEDGKKRVADTSLKTPASDKKAKIATPFGQTTGDKRKVPHVATPHPAMQTSKAPGNSDSKPKAKSPKSGSTTPEVPQIRQHPHLQVVQQDIWK